MLLPNAHSSTESVTRVRAPTRKAGTFPRSQLLDREEHEAKRMQMRLDKVDPDQSDPTPNDGSTPNRISLDKTE